MYLYDFSVKSQLFWFCVGELLIYPLKHVGEGSCRVRLSKLGNKTSGLKVQVRDPGAGQNKIRPLKRKKKQNVLKKLMLTPFLSEHFISYKKRRRLVGIKLII